MDETLYGTRDRRGHFKPKEPARPAPLFAWPPRPVALLRWLPHYFLPWNLFFLATAAAVWAFALPEVEAVARLEWGWVLRLLLVNALLVLLLFGLFELRLYVRRAQGIRFKYNPEFPSDRKNPAFAFGRQDVDNALRTFGLGVPIWTAWEAIVLHAFAAGWVPWVSFAQSPWYLIGLAVLLRLFHEAHFYCIHRLIHTPFLYKWVHSVHHNSVNPQPWSSLSMHP
ncbi:MAG: sterol desaturase family protein, partial [Geminicoccaceae bacterium]|nr:sterol desaturase family protein [Geminicoccaceae bacterium]